MRLAAENIRSSLKGQGIRGVEIHEHIEERPLFTLLGRPFFIKKQLTHMEIHVPFNHEGHDNRNITATQPYRGLTPNARLEQVIDMQLATMRDEHKRKGIRVQVVPWKENGEHLGHRILIQK